MSASLATPAGFATGTGVRVGIDIGGTFTDFVLSFPDGRVFIGKTSTTPDDPARGAVEGLALVMKRAGVHPAGIAEIVHGTTVGSNTILQREGARTGVLTTKGFRDVLEIGRIRTPAMFDLTWEKPKPLAPRRYRLEVTERIGAGGEVVQALILDEVIEAGKRFVAEGVEAVAICFINSYANREHEIAAASLLRERFPALRVTASHEVLPEMKEYERTSTTVVNAYLLPAMQGYLGRLTGALRGIGVNAPVQVIASNGGMMGVASASRVPVFAVASGPAGGVTGATALSRDFAHRDLIIFDMGGTTAKASIIEDGKPSLVTEYEFREGISSPSRFVKGGGFMLKVPAIDIAEVGAGGGSIAWIDSGGLLHAGPRSAGADPGPACYGLGNTLPTVTDANAVLGFLNPEALAGGSLKIDRDLAEKAVGSIAVQLGLPLLDAAHGIREVANVNMARAIRSVTVERGKDPRDMSMVAFGGSGPLHAADVGRLLGIRRVIIPVMSGVFSAAGMLASDVEHHFVRTMLVPAANCPPAKIGEAFDALAELGRTALASEGYKGDDAVLRFGVDLRYIGQSSDLAIPLELDEVRDGIGIAMAKRFEDLYRQTYGYSTGEDVEVASLRLAAIGVRQSRLSFRDIHIDTGAIQGRSGHRAMSLSRGAAPCDVPVLARAQVRQTPAKGPAVIESYDTAAVVPARASFRADAVGNIIIDLEDQD